jgi:hypothetical protein
MNVFVGSPEEFGKRSYGTKCIACGSVMHPDGFGVSCETEHERVVYTTLGVPSYSTYSNDIAEASRRQGWIVEKSGAMWDIKMPKTKWWQVWK